MCQAARTGSTQTDCPLRVSPTAVRIGMWPELKEHHGK